MFGILVSQKKKDPFFIFIFFSGIHLISPSLLIFIICSTNTLWLTTAHTIMLTSLTLLFAWCLGVMCSSTFCHKHGDIETDIQAQCDFSSAVESCAAIVWLGCCSQGDYLFLSWENWMYYFWVFLNLCPWLLDFVFWSSFGLFSQKSYKDHLNIAVCN